MATKAKQIDFLLSQVRNSVGSLAGGKIYFYEAGGTIPKTIWLDRDKASVAANPYTLDVDGTAQIYADGSYKIVIKNAAGSTIYTRDYLFFNYNDSYSEWVLCNATPTYISATQFSVPGNLTTLFPTDIRIKAIVTAGTIYGTVTNAVFTTLTTVTVSWDNTQLDSGLSSVSTWETLSNIKYIEQYPDLATAISIIGSTSTTLVIDKSTTMPVGVSLTFPTTLSVEIKKPGSITKNGFSLTINGPFEAGLYQVFSGFSAGDVTFGAGAVKEADPQWWGCLVDGSNDCKVAYDSAVASVPIGGTVHIPVGKSKISTAWSWNKQVNLQGDGPGSVLWIEGLAGSDAITFGPAAGYLYGVHWQDFAILGGATCCARGLVIRNVNNSQFDNIHVLLGSTVTSVWLKTFGIVNRYNFIISVHMISSYAYTPTLQTGKAIYASDTADAAGVFNANTFDCIIEGGPGYGLHMINSGVSGAGNVIKGTYEAIQGEFAILIEGGDGTRVKDTYLESTTISTNILKFLNHSYGQIGPGVVSLTNVGGYNDVQLVGADFCIIDGLRANRVSIDATTKDVNIQELWLTGQADYAIYDSGVGTRYYKAGSSATIATATPTTIFTPSGTGAIWEIFAFSPNAGAEYLANARLMWDGTNARIVSEDGALLTLTLSGNNVQVTQTSGVNLSVHWKYFKGASYVVP